MIFSLLNFSCAFHSSVDFEPISIITFQFVFELLTFHFHFLTFSFCWLDIPFSSNFCSPFDMYRWRCRQSIEFQVDPLIAAVTVAVTTLTSSTRRTWEKEEDFVSFHHFWAERIRRMKKQRSDLGIRVDDNSPKGAAV